MKRWASAGVRMLGVGVALAAVACGGDDDGGETVQGDMFCAALAAMEAKCQRCHGEPIVHGAPFPLLRYSDTRVRYPEFEDTVVADWIDVAVRAGYMPPTSLSVEPPVQALTPAERDALLDWVDAGAPGSDAVSCD